MGLIPSTWTRRRRLGIVTAAGILFFVTGIGLLLLIVAAMATLAPVILVWPVAVSFLSFVFGLAASVYAFRLADIAPRQLWLVYFNLLMCLCHVAALALFVAVFVYPIWTAVEERYVMPEGYTGAVVVVYNVANGEVVQRPDSQTVIYDIPSSGLLHTRGSPPEGPTRPRYFYKQVDGSLVSIKKEPIDRGEADSEPPVMVFIRAGIGSIHRGNCRLTTRHFYVGTREGFSSQRPGGEFQIDGSSCKLTLE